MRICLWLPLLSGSLQVVGFCRKPYSVIQGSATSSASGAELTELLKGTELGPELPLADHVHQLDPGNGRRG